MAGARSPQLGVPTKLITKRRYGVGAEAGVNERGFDAQAAPEPGETRSDRIAIATDPSKVASLTAGAPCCEPMQLIVSQ